MFVAGAVAILAAAAVPQFSAGVERTRAAGAARYVAGRLALARAQAVARGSNVAVLFTASGAAVSAALYVDGNGNGVRTREIAAGIDRTVAEAVNLAALFPHVEISLTDPADASSSATTALLSFTPLGTASSRSLYVRGRDGSQYAVRVLGATGRTRVLRYVPANRAWVEVL